MIFPALACHARSDAVSPRQERSRIRLIAAWFAGLRSDQGRRARRGPEYEMQRAPPEERSAPLFVFLD